MPSLVHKICHANLPAFIDRYPCGTPPPLHGGFSLFRRLASYGLDHVNGDECGLNLPVFIPVGTLHSSDSLLNRLATSRYLRSGSVLFHQLPNHQSLSYSLHSVTTKSKATWVNVNVYAFGRYYILGTVVTFP